MKSPYPRPSRRHLLSLSLGLPGSWLLAKDQVAGGGDEIRTISPQSNYYHGWSTVGKLNNGDLMVVWSGRRESHVCPFGTVEMMRSRDEGQTWTFPRTVADGILDDRDAGILETSRGTILITSFTSLAYEDHSYVRGKVNEDPAWIAAHRRLADDKSRREELGVWAYRSTDGGRTFSPRIDTVVNSPHGPCELEDGRLLYLGKQLWADEKRIGAAESRDDGKTWQWLAEVPTREGDTFANYHELHAVQCDSGKIVAQIRNHNENGKGETLQTVSEDGGATWSAPRSIGVWGLPSHLLKLKDGRLLMSYGYRRKPFGNQARVSDDEGTTWSEPITISDDGYNSDLGYPSTVELDDGSLLTIWYERFESSPRAQLRQKIWRLDT